MSDFHHVGGKGLFDPKFAEAFEQDRQKAVEDLLGRKLTQDQIDALNNIDLEAIRKLADTFGEVKPYVG